jgi:AraC-like DNA-binding protein
MLLTPVPAAPRTMTEGDGDTAPAGMDAVAVAMSHYLREHRRFGDIDMLEIEKPAGFYADAPSDHFVLLVPVDSECLVRFDFGAGVFEQRLTNALTLAPPGVECTYETAGPSRAVGFAIPAAPLIGLLHELAPGTYGDYGKLHAGLWRDNAVRDLALDIWRAGLGDRHAPALDPDAAMMRLAVMLAARGGLAVRGLEEVRDRLTPRTRRRVIDFIEDHLEESLPVQRLADVAELSPFHFCRAFRNDTGEAPHGFVLRRRLERAERMVRDGNEALAAVALACGFSSQSRMTEAFVTAFGITPGAMRRQARE